MGKHLKILEYALASLMRRRYKNGAVILAFTVTVATLASVLFLTGSLSNEARLLLSDSPELIVQRVAAGRHALVSTSYVDRIRDIPGVGRVVPRYWGYYYDPLTKGNYTILGLDDGPEDTGRPKDLTLLRGRLPEGAYECALGAGVAQARKVAVGEDLIIVNARGAGVSYEIVGIFETSSSLLTHDLIVMPRDTVRNFFDLPADRATDIVVQVFNPREVGTVAAKVKHTLPDTRPITREEILRTYASVFSWRSGMMLTIFSAALIAFCILAWDKATGISADERREIGILKAVGWDTSDVMELKFWEGVAISLTSFLLGTVAAWIHVFVLDAPVLAAVMKGWSVIFPPFALHPSFELYQILVLGFLTVIPYVASTVVPSWKAAVTDPDEIMRS